MKVINNFIKSESYSSANLECLTILKRIQKVANLNATDLEDWFNCYGIMPSVYNEDFIIEEQMFFNARYERQKALVPGAEEILSKRFRRRKKR